MRYLGGHWYLMTPKPVYFSHAEPRPPTRQFEENDPVYGHVYHLGSADDVLKMVNREERNSLDRAPAHQELGGLSRHVQGQGFLSQRSLHRRFVGVASGGSSEKRLCEVRCFGTNDDMSNWAPKPKFMLAEGDTYMKGPDDELFSARRQLSEARQGAGLQRELGADRRRNSARATSSAPPARFSFITGVSRAPAPRASTPPASNTPSRSNLPSWSGATDRRSTARSST